MSTRNCIAKGLNFLLYKEGRDKDPNIYLQLSNTQYSASEDGVLVRIPASVWEFIRHIEADSFNLLDRTEAEVLAEAERRVDESLREWEEAQVKAKDMSPEKAERFLAWAEFAAFRVEDRSREAQVKAHLDHFAERKVGLLRLKKEMAYYQKYHEVTMNEFSEEVRAPNDG